MTEPEGFRGTKGPWRWSNDYPTGDGRDTWSLLGGRHGFGILSCDGSGNSPQHINPADAALIAAAPDLLAALQGMVADYEDASVGDDTDNEPVVLKQARAAIARAVEVKS